MYRKKKGSSGNFRRDTRGARSGASGALADGTGNTMHLSPGGKIPERGGKGRGRSFSKRTATTFIWI